MNLWNDVRSWYMEKYPTDKLGEKISDCTFADVLAKPWAVYDILGVDDSLVREHVFAKISEIMGMDYDVIYKAWRDGGTNRNSVRDIWTAFAATC